MEDAAAMTHVRDHAATAPVRTCVGCRRREPQAALVRVVLVGDAGGAAEAPAPARAVVDARRRLPGRGAWVHPRAGCLQAASHGGLARSFRRQVDAAALQELRARLAAIPTGAPEPPPETPVTDDLSLATAAEKA